MQKIILASQSPRRKQLLQWAEVPFDVIVADTDEHYPPSLGFEEIAIYIARNKALAVLKEYQGSMPVLAADTIVVCEGKVLGKPTDREDAIRMLSLLQGKTHEVITGVVIIHQGRELAFADKTSVAFHPMTFDQLSFYVDKYKPYDKAGAYAIQEWIGVVGIKSIRGDFYNVMGLPVSRVVNLLKDLQ